MYLLGCKSFLRRKDFLERKDYPGRRELHARLFPHRSSPHQHLSLRRKLAFAPTSCKPMAGVSIIRAALTLSSDRRMLAITDEPMPNIRPMPVPNIKIGATILTAAMPLAPTPWPTKIPSVSVSTALNIIPIMVGKKIARKSGPILLWPKSILSRDKFLSLAILVFCLSPGKGATKNRILYYSGANDAAGRRGCHCA